MNRAFDNIKKLKDESALLIKMKKRCESRVNQNFAKFELKKFLDKRVENILFSLNFTLNRLPNHGYSVSTVETLPLVHLGIFKKIKGMHSVFHFVFLAQSQLSVTQEAPRKVLVLQEKTTKRMQQRAACLTKNIPGIQTRNRFLDAADDILVERPLYNN